MKKFKSLFFAFAFVIALAGAFAFTAKDSPVKKPGDVTYHYKLSVYDIAEMQDTDNWEVLEPGCGEEGDIPCAIVYDENINNFRTYLEGFSTVPALTAVANERKESE